MPPSYIAREHIHYKIVVLGDREFCSVELARWLEKQPAYFCWRQQKSTHIQPDNEDWVALGQLGLATL